LRNLGIEELRDWGGFRRLDIIFVHYVARSICESIKLPQEMPKNAKCLKCLKLRYSIDFINKKNKVCQYIHLLISYFSCCKYQTFIKKTERSDTIILGILEHYRHFRHFCGLSGLGIYEVQDIELLQFLNS
jgi:hypothetical protein